MIPGPMALLRALPVVLLAAALAGCADGSSASAPDGVVRLRLDEYRILPARVTVPAGPVTIVARDVGILTHNVHVFSTTRKDPEGNPIAVGGTPTAHPGETVTTAAPIVLHRGIYTLACTIGDHQALGQYATLVVR